MSSSLKWGYPGRCLGLRYVAPLGLVGEVFKSRNTRNLIEVFPAKLSSGGTETPFRRCSV